VITSLLLWKVLGGVFIGGGVAAGLLLLAGRTEDHLIEITLTSIIAYGAFLIAERLATSGVLASLTAGLVVGNIGWRGYIRKQDVATCTRRRQNPSLKRPGCPASPE
jgi:CPA1 family monovalent cation:H+ antiporter